LVTDGFRYGIEHETALLRADGRFADFVTTSFDEMQAVVDALPATEDPDLRLGDVGIKRTRWYVEGYERFDDEGRLLRCDPKGIEIRTAIHDSVESAVAALARDRALLDTAARVRGLVPVTVAFNPVRSGYVVDPPLNTWEHDHRQGSPEERTADLHMVTYGPDLNLSRAGLDTAALVDAGRKLTFYSPWLVPLSFSSPLRDGAPWGGLSARTRLRTGRRPAVLVFLGPGAEQIRSDPSLTQPARLDAEIGRIEFKAFDACPGEDLYSELLSLLTGLLCDQTLPGRATVPDAAAHRFVAGPGLADDEVHACTGRLLDAAEAALVGHDAHLARLASLRGRWGRRECPATELLRRYEAGGTVPALLATP
jgi:hypothetical protein